MTRGRKLVLTFTGTITFLVVHFLKAGMWPVPNLNDHLDVVRQAATPNPHANYFFTSYIQPSVFWLLGGRSLDGYVLYCAFLTVAFLVLLLYIATDYHPLAGVALLTFPVTMIPFYWIGVDGVTLLLMMAILLTLHSRWSWLLATLLSWHHFEQGILGFAILGVTLLVANRWEDIKRVVLLAPPFLLGRLILALYLHWLGIRVTDRIMLAWEHLGEYVSMWTRSPWLLVWSLFGAGWLLLLVRFRQTWPLLVASALAVTSLIMVTDHTRVGVVILFPALLYWVVFNRDFWNQCSIRLVVVVVIYLLVPPVYVWGGYACGRYTTQALQRFRAKPRVSTWTRLDYFRPFAFEVCGIDRKLVEEYVRNNPAFDRQD